MCFKRGLYTLRHDTTWVQAKFQWYLLEIVKDFQSPPSKPSHHLPKCSDYKVERIDSTETKLPFTPAPLPGTSKSRLTRQGPQGQKLAVQELKVSK